MVNFGTKFQREHRVFVVVYFSDKHSKRARDMHLLKQLKLLLKDEVTDNGMSSKETNVFLCIVDFCCITSIIDTN